MPKLWVRGPNGRTEERSLTDDAERRSAGIGKRWQVSFDGRTYRPYGEVKESDWRDFFEVPHAPDGEARAVRERDSVPRSDRGDDVEGHRVHEEARRVQPAHQEALETLRLRIEELAADDARFGQELAVIRANLQADIGAAVEGAVAPRVERTTSALIERVDAKLKRLATAESMLDDLVQEQVESVARYRPGTIDALRQQLAEERAEVERLRERQRTTEGQLDARDAEIRRLRSADAVVDPAVVDRLREDLSRVRGELEQHRYVEAERDELRDRVGELEAMREAYRALEKKYEADIETRRELAALLGRHEDLEREFDEMRQGLQRVVTSRDAYRESLRTRSEQLARAQDRARIAEEKIATCAQEIAELTAARDALTAACDGALERAREAEARFMVRQSEIEAHARMAEEAREREHRSRRDAIRADLENAWRAEREQLRLDAANAARERDQERKRAEAIAKENDQLRAAEQRVRERELDVQERERAQQAARAGHERAIETLREAIQALEDRVCSERDAAVTRRDAEAALQRGARVELEGLAVQVANRRAELDELTAKVTRTREDARAERAARVEILERPHFKDAGVEFSEIERERAWLEAVDERIREEGFQFSRRLLESFHTSLKIAAWAPLTVLAGVSGTGKSELPRLYSRFGGLRFLPIAVQPNWDSPQDLFGFFDYVSGRYRATPLVQAMLQSQRAPDDGGFEDGVMLVLLDEMNLARVELYFSELLSKLETRRGLSAEDARRQSALVIDLGAGVDGYELPLGKNVLWAGTMNEDESTQTLSDKVLDRGNVLSFPRPRRLHRRDRVEFGSPAPWLPRRVWEKWTRSPEHALRPEERETIQSALDDVNRALAPVQRAIGHRVMQAIERYVANHPAISTTGIEQRASDAWRVPFEDQIVQKVMPKLRGVSVDGTAGQECLAAMHDVLAQHAPGLVDDFDQARNQAQGAFVWTHAGYLEAEPS
jgi:hypothetical protein